MSDERPTFIPDEADAPADEPIDLPEHLQAEQPLPARPEPEPEPEAVPDAVGADEVDDSKQDEPAHAPGSFLAGLSGSGASAGKSGSGTADGGDGDDAAADALSDGKAEPADDATSAPEADGSVDEKPSVWDDDAKLAVLLRGAVVAAVLGAIVAVLAVTVVPEQLRISGLLLAAVLAGVAISMGHVGHRAEKLGQAPQEQLSRLSTVTGYGAFGIVVVAVLVLVVPLILGPTAQGELRTARELSVGDCVADPYGTWDDFGEEIGADDWWFDVVPCGEEHFGQVSLVNLAPTYGQPTYAQGDSDSFTECVAGFESFVGASWEASSLTVEDYYPTGSLWESAPYVVCIVSSGEPVTGSLQGSGL